MELNEANCERQTRHSTTSGVRRDPTGWKPDGGLTRGMKGTSWNLEADETV